MSRSPRPRASSLRPRLAGAPGRAGLARALPHRHAPGTQLAVDPDPGLGTHRVASGTVTVAPAEDITLPRNRVSDAVLPGGEEAQLGPGAGFMWVN
jgi:hypothetical protein